MPQNTATIATISVATVATGLLAYAVYFDQRRRANPSFRRQLRAEARRQARQEKESVVAQGREKSKAIHHAVDDALEEGFPTGTNEKEQYFMEQIQQGELLASDPSRTMESALAFYKGLKVYPTPSDLISIYDKTVDKRVIDVLAEMIAYDKDLDVTGVMPQSGINLSDMPSVGLD